MLINTSALVGEEFEYLEEAHLMLDGGRIAGVGDGYVSNAMDCKKYLVMPSFFNAHTHVGDSFAMEAALGLTVSRAVGRNGLKWKLYKESASRERVDAMNGTLKYMLESGTTGFSDFRERGINGIKELKTALAGCRIKPVILGRDVDESECDGLGLNLYQTGQIPGKRKKMLALHAGEIKGEVVKALGCNPDVIIHFTKAGAGEIREAAGKKISVVVCPRSNSLFGLGFPKVRDMLDAGINVSLGTDNVMLNQPDMFREMEYLSKVSRLYGSPLAPEEVLKMAAYNGAKAFGRNSGLVKKGLDADLTFLDGNASGLKYSRNVAASVVHRCAPEDVRKVMVDGCFVVNKDKK